MRLMLEALILAVLLAGRLTVSLPASKWLDEVEQWQHSGRQKRHEADPGAAVAEHTEADGDELKPGSRRESGSGAAEGGEDSSGAADGSGDEMETIDGIGEERGSGHVESDGRKETGGDDGSGGADESSEGSYIAEPVTNTEEHTDAGEEPDTEIERGPEGFEEGDEGSGAGDVESIARGDEMEGDDVSVGAGESSGGSDGVHEDELETETDAEGEPKAQMTMALAKEGDDAIGSGISEGSGIPAESGIPAGSGIPGGSGIPEGSEHLQINHEFESGITVEDTLFAEKDMAEAVVQEGSRDLEETVQDETMIEDGEHSMLTNATDLGNGSEDGLDFNDEEGHLVSSPGSGVNQICHLRSLRLGGAVRQKKKRVSHCKRSFLHKMLKMSYKTDVHTWVLLYNPLIVQKSTICVSKYLN